MRRNRMKKHFVRQNIALLCVLAVLALIMIYSGFRILESAELRNDAGAETKVTSKTITRNGREYFPRQDITVILVMGIDNRGPVVSSGYYRNSGDADMITLAIFDESNENCDLLVINRDTMLEMTTLGVRGEDAGTAYGQVALSHTYGTGLADSCENVKNTLEAFLPGLKIDYYVSMNMDAISILNDAVGGVTVTVTEDFSNVDATIPMGTVTLTGEQALHYVQTRKDVGDQLNISRLEREKAYMSAFLTALKEKKEADSGFIFRVYDEVSPYMVTDCSVNAISGIFDRYADYTFGNTLSIAGENVLGEKYYEFYPDHDALDAMTVELFYGEKPM